MALVCNLKFFKDERTMKIFFGFISSFKITSKVYHIFFDEFEHKVSFQNKLIFVRDHCRLLLIQSVLIT